MHCHVLRSNTKLYRGFRAIFQGNKDLRINSSEADSCGLISDFNIYREDKLGMKSRLYSA